jgi:hypothetical protein
MSDFERIGILKDSTCTLKETSRDNHDGNDFYMTSSLLKVVNFDLVKDKYIKDLSIPEAPKSLDAFYIDCKNEMYMIEFKSGIMDSKKRFDTRLKVFDSLLMLLDILEKGISFTRQNLNLILVYNENRNPFCEESADKMQTSQSRIDIGRQLRKKANSKLVRFNLLRFEKLYFKNVYTVTEEEFEKGFVANWH